MWFQSSGDIFTRACLENNTVAVAGGRNSSTSCPSSRTCNARGYSWHSVPPACQPCVTGSPPPEVAPYAQRHDAAVWDTLAPLLSGIFPQEADAQALAQLARHRTSPAACWAGWADALPVLRQRLPAFAETCACLLEDGGGEARSLRCAAEARTPS